MRPVFHTSRRVRQAQSGKLPANEGREIFFGDVILKIPVSIAGPTGIQPTVQEFRSGFGIRGESINGLPVQRREGL